MSRLKRLSISYWISGIVQTVRNKRQRRHEKVDENTKKFDYYYGIEADQFSFYRVPRLLIKDERFKGLLAAMPSSCMA